MYNLERYSPFLFHRALGPVLTTTARLTICKPDPNGEKMSIDSSQSESIELARKDAATQAIRSGVMDFIAGGVPSADVLTAARGQQEYSAILNPSSYGLDRMQGPENEVSKKEKKKRKKRNKEVPQAAVEGISPSEAGCRCHI